MARQIHLAAVRIHDHVAARMNLAGAGIHFLDLDDVAVRFELHIVENAHGRHDEAHLGREIAAQRLDLFGEAVVALRAVDERQEAVADLDLEVVDLERIGDRLFFP
jgi:hypothetical protein